MTVDFKYIIPCEYKEISESGGYYILKKGGKFGAADSEGKISVPIIYDRLEKFRKTGFEPLFAASLDGKCGVTDANGETVIPFKYSKIDVWRSRQTFIAAELNGKFGGIDENENIIMPFEYEKIERLRANVFKVKKNGKYALTDKSGAEITPFEFDEIGNLSEGLMAAKFNGNYGYITLSGKAAIGFHFKKARMFSDGIAPVIRCGKTTFEYINHCGETVLETMFDKVDRFSGGGLSYAHSKATGKWGFINHAVQTAIPCRYNNIFWQNGKIIVMYDENRYHFFKENGEKTDGADNLVPYSRETDSSIKYGLCSYGKSETIFHTEPEFDYIGLPNGGCRIVKKDGLYGVISVSCETKTEPPKPEFEIENETLIRYNGESREIDIPNGIKIISDGAFGSSSSKVVNISESVEHVETAVFFGVEEINVSENNRYFSSVNGILYSKDKKVLVAVPNGFSAREFKIPDGTEEIGECAFVCSNIDRVIFGGGIKKIGSFSCSGISEIVLPDTLEVIPEGSFSQCFNLESITLPPSLRYIGDLAFEECERLKTVHIPKNVTYIGKAAFPQSCKITADNDNYYAMKRMIELAEENSQRG